MKRTSPKAIIHSPRPPREGTRVRFQPNPVSFALYGSKTPKPGEEGAVTTVNVGGPKKLSYMPGPGGGLVFVKWDTFGVMGVSPIDIVRAPKGKECGSCKGRGSFRRAMTSTQTAARTCAACGGGGRTSNPLPPHEKSSMHGICQTCHQEIFRPSASDPWKHVSGKGGHPVTQWEPESELHPHLEGYSGNGGPYPFVAAFQWKKKKGDTLWLDKEGHWWRKVHHVRLDPYGRAASGGRATIFEIGPSAVTEWATTSRDTDEIQRHLRRHWPGWRDPEEARRSNPSVHLLPAARQHRDPEEWTPPDRILGELPDDRIHKKVPGDKYFAVRGSGHILGVFRGGHIVGWMPSEELGYETTKAWKEAHPHHHYDERQRPTAGRPGHRAGNPAGALERPVAGAKRGRIAHEVSEGDSITFFGEGGTRTGTAIGRGPTGWVVDVRATKGHAGGMTDVVPDAAIISVKPARSKSSEMDAGMSVIEERARRSNPSGGKKKPKKPARAAKGQEIHEAFRPLARELTGKECYTKKCFLPSETARTRSK